MKPPDSTFLLIPLVSQGTRITPETVKDIPHDDLRPEMLHPPGTSLIIAALHYVLGTKAYLSFEIFGALLDTLAACLVYAIRRFFFRRGWPSGRA